MTPPTADEIRAWREARSLTTKEAADRVYVSRRTWQAWEKGTNIMPAGLWELAQLKDQGAPVGTA
jgi:DNA-binding XRE family transcriptional regulator